MKTFLALALVGCMNVHAVEFLPFAETSEYSMQLDLDSVKVEKTDFEHKVNSIQLRTMKRPVAVEGSTDKISYYLDYTVVDCRRDTLTLVTTSAFTKEHKEVEVGAKTGTFKNPKIKNSVISTLIETLCRATENNRPKLTT